MSLSVSIETAFVSIFDTSGLVMSMIGAHEGCDVGGADCNDASQHPLMAVKCVVYLFVGCYRRFGVYVCLFLFVF